MLPPVPAYVQNVALHTRDGAFLRWVEVSYPENLPGGIVWEGNFFLRAADGRYYENWLYWVPGKIRNLDVTYLADPDGGMDPQGGAG